MRLLRILSDKYVLRWKQKRKWKKLNPHNFTYIDPISFSNPVVNVGKKTYGKIRVFSNCEKRTLHIGNFCSIAKEVTFLLALDHETSRLSTYPFKQKLLLEGQGYRDAISKGDIVVDDDVWIGYGATILSGVHIGQGAVIAAGAVVTKDIPPYAIAGGVPAKVIRFRFEQMVIDYLLTLDYSQLTEELIKDHIDDLYKPIDRLELDEVKRLYEWFPKKQGFQEE